MNQNNLDEIIENELIVLQEEKYKLRTFAIELDVQIDADFGVDQSLQRDTTSPGKYVERILVPEINGNHTPGVKILRLVNKPEQIG